MVLDDNRYEEPQVDYKVYEATITSGNNTHDVFTDMGRHGVQGYIVNDGDGDMTVSFQTTEASGSFGDAITIKAGDPIFNLKSISGTIVGFWLPQYMQGLNVPGYHLHFISDDFQTGGHILDCQILQGKIEIDYTDQFSLILPKQNDFYSMDLVGKKEESLKKVEKGE